MTVKSNYLIVMLLFCGSVAFQKVNATEAIKKIWLFDDGWYFWLEDSIKANDGEKNWIPVDIPHDWSIDLPFTRNSNGGIAVGHKKGGIGWYKKRFTLTGQEADQIITLCFEGVYMESEIWINGRQVCYHPNGYTPFRCDITAYCHPPGIENELIVKVVNNGKNSRWYSGSGIYRHVWLMKTGKIHLDTWHTSVTTGKVSGDLALVSITADLFNDSGRDVQGNLLFEIFDAAGREVKNGKEDFLSVHNKMITVHKEITVPDPQLWSPETPTLYKAKVKVQVADKMADSIEIFFGIRTITFSAETGFQLNGKTVKLKGGCIHHDNGLLGAAAIDRAEIRKVVLLKANGFNAVRCAHNPPSEAFLAACDSLGLLVIDEAFDQWQKPKNPNDYHRFFDVWGAVDMESIVRRDRNHPSIIMWSIGNEIQERADSSGMSIAVWFRDLIRALDTTRPVTAAVNAFWDNPLLQWEASERVFQNLDVCGYNYMWWEYKNDHKLYPGRIIYGSESTAMERALNWDLVESYPFIIGDFVWTAMDYLGESGIGNTGYYAQNETDFPQFLDYPWFNGWCGDVDICGNSKPQALFRDVVWHNSNIEMLVHAPVPKGKKEKVSYWGWPDEEAHWNWNGFEDTLLDVRVFTRYTVVRLYLNDHLLEEKEMTDPEEDQYTVSFKVPYRSGKLKATGLLEGKPVDSLVLETAGRVCAVRLRADRPVIRASRNDLAYVSIELIDDHGKVVPDQDLKVTVRLKGNGKVFAGNANPLDMNSFRSLSPVTFKGKALAIIQPLGNIAEKLTLEVSSPETGSTSIDIITY